MRLDSVNIAELAAVLRACEGQVCLITAEGDCISADSVLYNVIGLANLFKVAETQDVTISCEKSEDQQRIEQFIASQA